MGIIAALLATVTYTAALSVSTGIFKDIFEEIGTEKVVNKAAFMVFIISDVIAIRASNRIAAGEGGVGQYPQLGSTSNV
ncbi:Endonuclease MutS2 [Bienertia sinuspersici]